MLASAISSPADSASVSQTDARDPARTSPRKLALPRPTARATPPSPQRLGRRATDDEILGIGDAVAERVAHSAEDTIDSSGEAPAESPMDDVTRAQDAPDGANIPEALRAALDANPELRRVWDDAQAYREAFATPEAARAATAQLADLNHLDSLFFSRRPEDHAELARTVAGLDPVAFASPAQAMATPASRPSSSESSFPVGARPPSDKRAVPVQQAAPNFPSDSDSALSRPARNNDASSEAAPSQAQTEFFHSANDAAVLEAIELQVERLLPEGISKNARNRVVGEIYRELDTTLRSNRELGEQMRQAFRSGALDTAHQRAIVSLVTGRARQALPGVARRVLSEWTSTLVAANQDRRTRQRTAERRVDIAGASGGNDGRRAMTPRDFDYTRLSDSDILNL